MKYILAGIIIVVLVIAGFWAYAKFKKGKPGVSPTTAATRSQSPLPSGSTSPGPSASPAPVAHLGNRVGDILPDFRLQSLGRGSVSLWQYRGTDVVISLWNSQCTACLDGFGGLLADQQRAGDRMVTLLINRGESETVVRKHTEMFLGTRVMILLDPADTVHRLLGSDALPYRVVVSPDGVIRELR